MQLLVEFRLALEGVGERERETHRRKLMSSAEHYSRASGWRPSGTPRPQPWGRPAST